MRPVQSLLARILLTRPLLTLATEMMSIERSPNISISGARAVSPQLTRAARLLVEPGRATAARRRLRNRGSAALLTSARAWRYAISDSQQLLRDVAPTKRVHVARMRPRSSRRRARSPSAERRDRPRRLGRHAQRPHLDATESSTGDARRHLRRLVEILDPVEAAELLLRRGERSVRLQHLPVFVRAPSSPSTSAPAPRPIDRTSGMSLGPSTEPRTDRILGPSRLCTFTRAPRGPRGRLPRLRCRLAT